MASCEVEEIGLLAKRQFAIGIVSKSGNFPCENNDMWLGTESDVRIIAIGWTLPWTVRCSVESFLTYQMF